jgi:phage tail-like protein
MATRKDPYVSFNFLVEIDGIVRAAFHEAGGLDSSIDVIEHREGGENITTRKLPGMVKFSNIVLKWGITDDQDLYNWHRQWAKGDPAAKRKSGSVVLLDRQGQEKRRQRMAGQVDGPDVQCRDQRRRHRVAGARARRPRGRVRARS